MKLVKVIIKRYKSIIEPIEIDLHQNFITFIGKNGSGKTNVLTALKRALSKDNSYASRDKEELIVDYIFEITQQEVDQYFYAVDIKPNDRLITVHYQNDSPQVRKIDAPIINWCVKEYRDRMQKIYDNFSLSAQAYIENLRLIEERDYSNWSYLDIKVKSNGGRLDTLYRQRVDWIEKELKRQREEIASALNRFDSDNIEIDQNSYLHDFYILSNTIQYYELGEQDISISPIVAESLNLDATSIKEANRKLNDKIKKVNKELKNSFQGIQKAIEEFEQLKKEIANIFSEKSDLAFDIGHQYGEAYKQFMQLLKETIFGTGYFIDNEHSLLFYRKEEDYQKSMRIKEYLNLDNPILSALDTFLQTKKYYKNDESILKFNEISAKRKVALVEILNTEFLSKIVPNFEKGEIVNYQVRAIADQLVLVVQEKNGQEIDIEKTSLGRRWYLTYKIISALLKEGDYLFIDEPAAFLHPQAQVEILEEIEQLSNKGVHIFMTTHSPYMISSNWENVISLNMTDEGTWAKRFIADDDMALEIKQNLGDIRSKDILFNLSKTILLVEGIVDKICIEKMSKVLNYDINGYHIMPCNGSPIFDVTYLCITQQIKFKALFDLDNKQKPEKWMDKKYGYKEYLEIFEKNPSCVFTPEIRTKKSLEDCFNEVDNERYFSDFHCDRNNTHTERKIDKDKIKVAMEFDDETKYNFEQLFKKLGIPKLD